MERSWATGEQYPITFEGQSACITEVGAALRAYSDVDGAIVDGTEADEPISAGRGQVLIPWPNRVKDGKYSVAGKSRQLPITEVDLNNSSHGLLRWVNWKCEEHTSTSVTMTYASHAQSGYPFAFDARITYSLGSNGLRVVLSGMNTGPAPMPFGMGCHPYFTVGTESVDDTSLMCPAAGYLPSDAQEIPSGDIVMDDDHDYRTKKAIGDTPINACWTQLERDGDGIASVDFTRNDNGRGLRVWMDETFDYVMLYTGETVPQPERRRKGFAIEPMTCAPNAYNNGLGLRVLQPGESVTGAWGVHRI
jgi:aldose 1-epimerase